MLNSILESRSTKGGLKNIILEIPEKEYKKVYDTYTEEDARDILEQYLNYHQDDVRPSNIKIEHEEYKHIVKISADLHYLGNKKTEPKYYTETFMKKGRNT